MGLEPHDLFDRHAGDVARFLARRAGSDAAADLLGDVFVAALSGRGRWQPHPSGSELPWLYGIARNVVREHLRRRRPLALLDDEGVDWDAVDDRVDAAGQRGRLRAALDGLGPVDRELLLLVAWEDLGPAEAGAVLGLSPTAARTRLHRARTRAQASLASEASRAAR